MAISLTTPMLLFPATSLILLAYTAKLAYLSNLARTLYKQYTIHESEGLLIQIRNLRKRIYFIKNMQAFGSLSFCLCTISVFMLLNNWMIAGEAFFGISSVFLVIALYLSFKEVWLSAEALKIVVKDVCD
ncbi:DUF2721 domain-containing protein [Arcticibacter eurypsychrophilus]|uniref:DUF2721 domain-containing protein n=1 Tax=Arcticibacter eurypsychrophilus TaxID=1434752 RepID=UPI00084D518E|nr:DUF2721 domain-containing protein [Arcticibacter eurypsychrophilus]